MTTITRLKQLKDWLKGSQQPERVVRKVKLEQETTNKPFDWLITLDRFASYREKIMPKLQETGYGYFLACDSKEYQIHQEWCNKNCEEDSLGHCDVWQVASCYPRAFASRVDAALFVLHFDATNINGDE
jgi:hypothetical protein